MRNAAGKVSATRRLHTEPMELRRKKSPAAGLRRARLRELERMQADARAAGGMQELQRLRDRLQAENVYLQERSAANHNFDEIVGSDPKLSTLLEKVTRVAAERRVVLIHGETGTARSSSRAPAQPQSAPDRPLVK